MTVETVAVCPLGSKCEEIKDNKLHRCMWSIELDGVHPTTGESIQNKGCAMAWVPILLIENSKQQRSTAAAVESFRNEMAQANANSQLVLLATASRSTQTLIEG